MKCTRIPLPGNPLSYAIVCTAGGRTPRCGCGTASLFQCDWKIGRFKSGKRKGEAKTCDAHLCGRHAKEVAPDKHLCPAHQLAWTDWQARHPITAKPAS